MERMKKDNYEIFRPYLQPEKRIEVGIPLTGGGVFRDWAIISESDGDFLLAQISRDVLPANVRIDIGFLLDVSVTIKEDVFTCSGVVTEKFGPRVLRIQLFGEFNLRERRRFFRLELNLKIKYALVTDESRMEVENDWERRRDLEHLKFQGFDEFALAVERARFRPPRERDWRVMLRSEVNLGGGGIGIRLPESVYADQLICLEIHLPMNPPREIPAVAQVMMVKPPEQRGRRVVHEAGMQFICLDDKDRELIFRHISVAQIAHLRETADRRDNSLIERHEFTKADRIRLLLLRTLWTLLALTLVFYLVKYAIEYESGPPANEIQKTYEKAIRQYRHQE
jgi:hypothetical protein